DQKIEYFKLFNSDNIVEKITAYTNIYIDTVASNYKKYDVDAKHIDEREIRAMIGLLIIAGARRSNHQNLEDFIPLAEKLCKSELTLVGTLRNNKKELRSDPVNVEDSLTRRNKNKNVFAISSMHFDDAVDSHTGEDRQPEIIIPFNITVLDKMLLDIAGINSQVIFSFNKPDTTLIRRKFLREISLHLVKPQIYKRTNDQRNPRYLCVKAVRISKVDPVPSTP
ncbi:hypothetical protein ILUMI_16106, partial [Ignelater luminosus]